MRDVERWLPDLVPLPGGLSRLQASIRADRRQSRPPWASLAAAACVVAVVLGLLPGTLQRYRARQVLVQAVRGATQSDPEGLRVIRGAAIALSSGQPDVHLYLVQPARAEGDGAMH